MWILKVALLSSFLLCESVAQSCLEKCSRVWSGSETVDPVQFSSFANISHAGNSFKVNWKWRSQFGVWDVFYATDPRKGLKTGGFLLVKPIRKHVVRLNWKWHNHTLSWSSRKGSVPSVWNLTMCHFGVTSKFEGDTNGWTFFLGNVKISSGENGKMKVDEYLRPEINELVRRKRQSETEDLGPKAQSVWDKLKGYFKELFDQGPGDERGWITRISDWLLGFLERLLS